MTSLGEEDCTDLCLVDFERPRQPFEPGDLVVHSDDVSSMGTVIAARKTGWALVVWSKEPAASARDVASHRRALRDEIDRQIIGDLSHVATGTREGSDHDA